MTTEAVPSLRDINLMDPDIYVRGLPHDQWKRLRAQAPVFWHERWQEFPAHWDITRYDDVMRISRDPATFISGQGITAGDDPEARAAYEAAHPENAAPSGHGTMMITTDPPRHVRLRRLVNKGFTPRMVAAMEPHIRRIVKDILDKASPLGECDFVTEISSILPLAVICDLMGVPQDDWQTMFELTNKTLGAGDPEYQAEHGDAEQTSIYATNQMFGYFAQMVAARKAERKEDLVSVLVDADIDGEMLTDAELYFFCFLLIVAGNETTRNATTGGLMALLDHPDQWARLRGDPSLLPTAIEEILRWTSPVLHMARFATRDVELRGQTIREGQKVVMWYPSVNRDEAIFPDGDRFNITRTPNDHLAFGIGEHFCLGASLARLELRVMFEQLAERLPDIERAGEAQRLRSNFIGGIKHLPVRFTPR